MNLEAEREMWDAIVKQDRLALEEDFCYNERTELHEQWETEKQEAFMRYDADTFEADLPGELVDLMPCEWCGKPVFDLVPFYGNIADPTHAYMICEDCMADTRKPDPDDDRAPF